MQPPVTEMRGQFVARYAQAGNEEDYGHGAVKDGVFGTNDAAVAGNGREEVGQEAGQPQGEDEPLVKDKAKELRGGRSVLFMRASAGHGAELLLAGR